MHDPRTDAAIPPNRIVLDMLIGRWISQAISAAAELGLADHVTDGPQTPETLAGRVHADAPSIRRLLRALASVGMFAEDEGGRFAQTPLSETLRSDVPGSIRGMALHVGAPASVTAWADLTTSIRTGEPAFRRVHGKSFFEYLAGAPDHAKAFDHAMHGVSSTELAGILAAYDFSDAGVIVDVGGGDGTLLGAILARYPQLRGVVADLPHVIARTREGLRASPLRDRIELVEASFFETVPSGGATYLLKHILHDWSDELSTQILRHVRRAIPAGGRVLVFESVLQAGNAPDFGKLLDLEMIAITEGGRERTERDFAALLDATGFRLARVVPTRSPVSVIEGRPT